MVSDLIEEEDISVSEGAIKDNISKSFVNIDAEMHRRSERLANKKSKSLSYFAFVPELDVKLSNPMAFSSRLDNETYTFREILNQPDASDLACAIEKEISMHELHDR